MKKVLFVATTHHHFHAFHVPYIKWLKEQQFIVHCAANDNDVLIPFIDKQIFIPIQRSPYRLINLKAYFDLKRIIENENYDLIHCHTAMGAVIARLATRENRQSGRTKLIYTAHGFHFFKGSPLKYWLLYYPIEKFLSRYTDAIITINKEDYDLIKNKHFKNKDTYKISGIGVHPAKTICTIPGEKNDLRKKLGYKADDFILIYIAELIPRKNHIFIIDTLFYLLKEIAGLKILFAGSGKDMEEIIGYIHRKGYSDVIDVLGFRKDIAELIKISDIGISSSKQEGLPMNIAEIMFNSMPVVASKIRGHTDLVEHDVTGFLFDPWNKKQFAEHIIHLYRNKDKISELGKNAFLKIQKFSLDNTLKEMQNIYKRYL